MPELAVVVVVRSLRERAGGCIASLLADSCVRDGRVEILVVDLAPHLAPVAGGDATSVRLLARAGRLTFAEARATAVREAKAPIVAFLEEHCRVAPGWGAALLERWAEGDWVAVGPAMSPGSRAGPVQQAAFVMGYGLVATPQIRREVQMVAGHNASYRRNTLLDLGADLEHLLSSDNVLGEVLLRRGGRFAVAESALVFHHNERSWHAPIRGALLYHRANGRLRAAYLGWSWLRRGAQIVGFPLVPLWFTVLAVRKHLRAGRRDLLVALLRAFPLVLAAQFAAGLGQSLGLLFGPGSAEHGFTRFELEEERV